jgi:hypothetical protein
MTDLTTNPLGLPQYPLPTEAKELLVTPDMASDWRSHRTYENNRRVSPAVSARYQRDMEAGLWKLTRQGLIFDTNGKLIDGGHRVTALSNADPDKLVKHYGEAAVPFWVYPNEARDTFDALDQGYKRQAAHLLHVPNATTVAAGARWLAALASQDVLGLPRFQGLTNTEVYATARMWPELERYASEVNNLRLKTYIAGAAHEAILAQASRTEFGTPEAIQEWFRGLNTGVGLADQDPRLKLRNRFLVAHHALKGTANRNLVYALIAKSWNAYAQGEGINQLSWRSSVEAFPKIVGFDWATQNKEN